MLLSRPVRRPLLLLLVLLALPLLAQGAYRYRDPQGNVSFTDDWRTIPLECRASADPPLPAEALPAAAVKPAPPAVPVPVLAPDPPPAPATTPPPAVALPPVAAVPLAEAASLWQNPWVKLGAFAAGFVLAFLLLLKLVDYIPSPMLGRLILLAFFLGTLAYGYKLYVDNMTAGYFAVKDRSVKLMEKAMKREQTAVPGLIEETAPK